MRSAPRLPARLVILACMLIGFPSMIGCGAVSFRFGPAATSEASMPVRTSLTAPAAALTTQKAATAATTAAATTATPLPTQAGVYGNTNGNLANGGFAAYDSMTRTHLLGIDKALVRYDPANGVTSTVVALSAGRPTFINAATDAYYFISSADSRLYRVARDGSGLQILHDAKCTYAGRVNQYLQINADLDGVPELQVILLGSGSTQPVSASSKLFSGVATEISLGSNRVYYRSPEGSVRVSSSTGSGRTNIYSGAVFQAMHHLFQVKEDVLVFVDKAGTGETLYTFKSNGEPSPLLGSKTFSGVPSLNFDGTRYVFIGVAGSTASLYEALASDLSPRILAQLPSSNARVNLAGSWVYLQDKASGALSRMNPGTGVMTPVSP